MGGAMTIDEREAARVILLTPESVLLLRHRRPDDGFEVWLAPGGRLEPGEGFREAALRELREELGQAFAEIHGPVWSRTNEFVWNGTPRRHFEQFFWLRVDGPFDCTSVGADRDEGIVDHKWWQLDELVASRERFSPVALPALVRDLATNGPPKMLLDVNEGAGS